MRGWNRFHMVSQDQQNSLPNDDLALKHRTETSLSRWWFPRTWRKGTQQEAEIRKAEFTPEDRTWAKQVIARAEAKARGEAVGEMPGKPGQGDLETGRPPPAYDIPPPVYG